jgi:hypothetical protein
MAHFNTKTIRLYAGVSALACAGLFSGQVFAMSPFQASYQFNYNGKNMGSATRTLSKTGQQWKYVFAAKAVGVASATETSVFNFNDQHIQSSSFSRTSKVLVHNNTMSIRFNPSSKLIQTKKDDKARSFAWKNGVLDELNAELQIREDLKKGSLKSTYPIADAKEVENRRFVKQGNEKVKAGNTTYDTVKVVMKHDKPGRETIFWLAPKLDYLPVKVTHVDQKTNYGLLLNSYNGPTN